MTGTILIAGKELPAVNDFAGALSLAGYNVAITAPRDTTAKKSGSLLSIPWNRPSAISARNVLLQTENEFQTVDTVILYFDAAVYSPQFVTLSHEECSRALDVMSSGYQHMAIECATRFEQKHLSGRLIFIYRTHPTMTEAARSASASIVSPCGPLVAAAMSAFKSFAENAAAIMGEKPNTDVYLVSCDDPRSEVYNKDSMLALWLNEYLSMTAKRVSVRDRMPRRQSVQWVKAGSKGYGIFPFLR